MKKIMCLFLLLLNQYVLADGYQCTVNQVSTLEDDGILKPLNEDSIELYGRDFILDRETGQIIDGIKNHSVFGEVLVLAQGSDEEAFKAVTLYRSAETNLAFIRIKENVESDEKPFLYLTVTYKLLTGTCIKI